MKVELIYNHGIVHKENYHIEHNEIQKNKDFQQNAHGHLSKINKKIALSIDEDTGKYKIKIYNYLTGEVLDEIPSDLFLKYLKQIKENYENQKYFDVGLFFDKLS